MITATELQELVDSLAVRLKRAVLIDDPSFRLLSYSAHRGRLDRVRRVALALREAPPEAKAWIGNYGLLKTTEPVRVPGDKANDIDARLCVPIRSNETLYGFIWLIDDPPLSSGEMGAVIDAAEAAAKVMDHAAIRRDLKRAREGELFRDLLSERPEIRNHAAQELIETDTLVEAEPVAVICILPTWTKGGVLNERTRLALGRAMDTIWRFTTPRHSLCLLRPNHGVVLVVVDDPMLRSTSLEQLAVNLASAVSSWLPVNDGWRVVAGIGDMVHSRVDAYVSYGQAQAAARLAELVPSYGPVVSWTSIGVYRTLMTLTAGEVVREGLHPGLMMLFRHRDGRPLVRTLELYFDLAGDAPAVAAALGIHRATLYHRLHRIERITGLSLQRGDDRLSLHLGLKLARLAGAHPLFPCR